MRGHSAPRGNAASDSGQWRIGVDVGGTFTDLALMDGSGAVEVVKVPSFREDPARGVLEALAVAAGRREITVEALLGNCEIFVHGSTVATNTVLEGKGARVGLLTTKGFRDTLEIRRGIRPDPWKHREAYPEVLVPRFLRQPVGGRIDRDGAEQESLSRSDISAALAIFKARGVEAVAVGLFNSFLSAAHELKTRDAINDQWDLPWISLSSEVSPVIGEYERTSTAVVNAYIAPRTITYLNALAKELAAKGLRYDMLLMQNNAGMATLLQLAQRPATLLLSGPAAAVGALEFFSQVAGSTNLISMEIGGTSCDITLMAEGRVDLTDSLSIGGYELALPSVDVQTIGAGGGTIAGVDVGGLLFVGPAGAGSDPGPACFGRGGDRPTVTDAQVVLGRLGPGTFADGTIFIDQERARLAVAEHVGDILQLQPEEAAAGIIRLLEQKLLQALQAISSQRGCDPRRFTLVAAGGAGALHGASVARLLGCKQVFVPKLAGGFCAMGMLNSDLRQDYMKVVFADVDCIDPGEVHSIWDDLAAEAGETLAKCGLTEGQFGYERSVDMRYRGQQWDVTVPLGARFIAADVRARFEREHERLFGHIQPQGSLELTKVRLAGFGRIARANRPAAAEADRQSEPTGHRNVWIDEKTGWEKVPIYSGASLLSGHSIAGPAIIEEMTTTILLGHGDRLEVLATGDYIIHVG